MILLDLNKNKIKEIETNSKIAIYGSNNVAGEIYNIIKKLRADIEIKFFIDTNNTGEFKNLPIYLAENLDEHKNDIDGVIIASYSNRFFMEFILKFFEIKNIFYVSKSFIKQIEKNGSKTTYDIKKSSKVFKTIGDKILYLFLNFARKHKMECLPLIKHYNKIKYPIYIDGYPQKQYFEFINKKAIDVAMDVGACDGIHSILMAKYLPNCKKVYTLEPCYNSFKKTLYDKMIKKYPEIEIIEKAAWKESTVLEFREDSKNARSAIVEKGATVNRKSRIIKVETISIDDFVEQNNILKLDYIKMDIENAEMEALKGAEKSILKFRPQLAISIYHSDEQFYEIPLYLNKLLSNYVFRLAHYRKGFGDTILYAIPKELL